MHGLVLFEFEKEGVEGFEVVGRRGCMQVEDGRKREAEEKVVGGATGEVAWSEGRETGEVLFRKKEGVEPIDTSFVAGRGI